MSRKYNNSTLINFENIYLKKTNQGLPIMEE